jgi:ATP-dependent DNA helicase DinG
VDAAEALDRVVAGLGSAGEPRPGQRAMAEAVERAIVTGRHLFVQAGTGTGKSLGYLVPAILSGRRVVVATATKALQDQLIDKDLPFLERHLGRPFTFAYLKGRSNYLCVQRAREAATAGQEQLAIDGMGEAKVGRQLRKLLVWASEELQRQGTGDRAALPFEPAPSAWAAVSVSARECPGARQCPSGEVCFGERARERAAEVDVLVVNSFLYAVHLAGEGGVLPEHDVVVIDEAHVLEEVMSATAGVEIGASRFVAVARAVRGVLADDELIATVAEAGNRLADALDDVGRQRVRVLDGALEIAMTTGRARLERALGGLRQIKDPPPAVAPRRDRAVLLVSNLIEDIDAVAALPDSGVVFVETGPTSAPVLRLAPIDVREALAGLWSSATVVLTSATLNPTLPARLGAPPANHDYLDVGSPFDYKANARLYCARDIPAPNADGWETAMHDELAALIEAAGGRTMALFTSWRRMETAVGALRSRVATPILAQGELPKPKLVERFAADEATSLFATMGFWQGIDVPGRSLSLVTIDRLPFSPPDDPLLQARRERAGPAAFSLIDVPRAATLLAQGVGRLIRTAVDRGVVAVFDRRLATSQYRQPILDALPPMRRVVDRAEVEAFLRDLVV